MSEELANLPIVEELGAALVAGFRRREAGRLRKPALRAAALAVAAALGAGAVLATELGGADTSPAQAAARVLGTLARAAEAQPVRLPGPKQFFFVEQRSTLLLPIRPSDAGAIPAHAFYGPDARVTIDSWVAWSPTRTGAVRVVLRSVTFPTPAARARWVALGKPPLYPTLSHSGRVQHVAAVGGRIPLARSRSLSVAQLLALPADPGRLYRKLFLGLPAVAAFDAATALNLYPLRPPVRAALYRALARVRGIAALGAARSPSGRAAIALGVPDGGVEDEIILDPQSGALLGSRTVVLSTRSSGLVLGTVRSQTFVVARAITNRPAPPRSP